MYRVKINLVKVNLFPPDKFRKFYKRKFVSPNYGHSDSFDHRTYYSFIVVFTHRLLYRRYDYGEDEESMPWRKMVCFFSLILF